MEFTYFDNLTMVIIARQKEEREHLSKNKREMKNENFKILGSYDELAALDRLSYILD